MRILAIDPGDRRLGLAVSDELGITAQGLETFDRRSGGDFFVFLSTLFARYDVEKVIVGNPLNLSGRSSSSSEKAKRLAEELQRRFGLDVELWDERLSSVEAKRVLKGSRAEKAAVDKVAAVIILQSYLDFRRRGS